MTPVATSSHVTSSAPLEVPRPENLSLREGTSADAGAIHALIEANLAAGHLLPRSREDVDAHVTRFVVLEDEGTIVGCAELAPLSRAVAEVRSLVVDDRWRGRGLGTSLIADLSNRARRAGFTVLCAFTHNPHQFIRLGFSIVPHVWFSEKIALDCTKCAKFRQCGQHAMALGLTSTDPLPSLRRLREPLTSSSSASDQNAALRPVRLRVIA